MLGHQFHSDTTRYYGDCTYVRGCVWKMERERERWEWGLDITEQESISHSGVQQRRGGGGLGYSHGWLADSWQWLCDLSQPGGKQRAVFWTWKPGFSRLKLEGHESHYFSQQVNQDDLHLGDKQATQAEGRDRAHNSVMGAPLRNSYDTMIKTVELFKLPRFII